MSISLSLARHSRLWTHHFGSGYTGLIGVKHEAMKRHHGTSEFVTAPAYPFTGPELFENVRARLARALGRPIGFKELGRIMGQPTSNTHFWFKLYQHPHVLALMTLLERLSPAERHEFIDKHCRVYPSLSHSNLFYAPGAKNQLQALLLRKTGLTVMTGGSLESRNFIFTALGHSVPEVCGIDVHSPRRFVPIPSIHYLDESTPRTRVQALTLRIWPRLATAKSQLLLLNGVWSSVPAIRLEVLGCAQHKHVIVAEKAMPESTPPHALVPNHEIAITEGSPIRVECRPVV